MKPPVIGDAYERYMKRVKAALEIGLKPYQIIQELKREKASLKGRATVKAATLVTDPNPYKKREAIRAAHECMTAIERIISELEEKKEIPA